MHSLSFIDRKGNSLSFFTEYQIITGDHQNDGENEGHKPVGYKHGQDHAECDAEHNDPGHFPELLHLGHRLSHRALPSLLSYAKGSARMRPFPTLLLEMRFSSPLHRSSWIRA